MTQLYDNVEPVEVNLAEGEIKEANERLLLLKVQTKKENTSPFKVVLYSNQSQTEEDIAAIFNSIQSKFSDAIHLRANSETDVNNWEDSLNSWRIVPRITPPIFRWPFICYSFINQLDEERNAFAEGTGGIQEFLNEN